MGASPEVLPLINDYTNIWLLGCFLIVVPMVGNSAIRAAGDTRVPSFIMLSVALVNIILDPIFIFGLFGFPRLELKGAALATIVAYAISFVLAIFFLKYRLNLIDFSCFRRGCVRSWQAICSLAVPVTVTNLIAPLAATLSLWLISDFGTSAVAGYSIAARMETFAMVPILAVASVMGALAGQNYGAGHLDRTNFAIKKGHQFVVIWGLLVATIFWVFRVELIGLFSEEPLVLETASIYLKLVPLGYLFVGLTMITSGALTGVGFPVYGLLLTVSRLIILYCPLALILKNFLDVQGIFLAMLIANIVIGCCALKLIQLSKLQLN